MQELGSITSEGLHALFLLKEQIWPFLSLEQGESDKCCTAEVQGPFSVDNRRFIIGFQSSPIFLKFSFPGSQGIRACLSYF